jgi:hypothetical protein
VRRGCQEHGEQAQQPEAAQQQQPGSLVQLQAAESLRVGPQPI